MFNKLAYFCLELILFIVCRTPVTGGITVYEYGIHIEGEESTFAMNGVIPALTQVYTVNATPTRPEFESKFSFLKIEYNSPMSPVEIEFNPKTNVIAFYIRFPFMDIPFGIVGYSLKKRFLPGNNLRSKMKCCCNRN